MWKKDPSKCERCGVTRAETSVELREAVGYGLCYLCLKCYEVLRPPPKNITPPKKRKRVGKVPALKVYRIRQWCRCVKCGLMKTLRAFSESGNESRWCKECSSAHTKAWKDANKAAIQARERKLARDPKKTGNRELSLKKYKLTEAQYQEMMDRQKGVCWICAKPQYPLLHVDHCHSTKKVRGLLCARCNTGLGQFEDQIARLERAIEYLRGSGAPL